jgi:hypothetical protein
VNFAGKSTKKSLIKHEQAGLKRLEISGLDEIAQAYKLERSFVMFSLGLAISGVLGIGKFEITTVTLSCCEDVDPFLQRT